MEERLLKFLIVFLLSIVLMAGVSSEEVNVRITDNPVAGQAEDMRIGVHIGNSASRYHTNLYNNFIGNGDFEDSGSWTQFPVDDMWNHDVPGLSYSYDSSEFYDGRQSLKVTVNSAAVGNGVGQWASNKEYQEGKEYVFSCYMKQDGMAGGNNAELKLHFFDTGSNCPGGFVASEDFSVTDDWHEYEMTFTMDKDCKPRDPISGGANSKRINLLSEGTLYIDRCILYDKEQMTPWMINSVYLDLLKDLRPYTIRYGALDANDLLFEEQVGEMWGRPQDRAGIAEFLQLAKLIGASPDNIISTRYSDEDYSNILEFMFGSANSTYGQMREEFGYPAWDFDNFYYELGCELMCRSTSSSYPGPCHWESEEYADWSTYRINLFKGNPNWDPSRDKIGFNVWYDANVWNIPLLEEELGNAGGNADFIMPAKYFDGSNAFRIAEDGTRTEYTDSQLTSDTDLYYNFVFGTAELMNRYVAFFDELTAEFYDRKLEFGLYEYGPGGYPEGKSTQLFDLEKSLGFGVSWLDMSVMLKRSGAAAINSFYFQGSFDSYSWAMVDAYPYERKRPSYYLFSMYGRYIRGEILEREISGPSFDPFGPGADQEDLYGCNRGGSSCKNSDWGLTDWKYPVDVPIVEIYPFRFGSRYSFLIINRDVQNQHEVIFDIPYSPGSDAIVHYVTGSSPEVTNENADNAVLESTVISDFDDNYILTVEPHSAYVLVNYAEGAPVCMDEDQDGYGDNGYENDCSNSAVDCVDFNEYIHPENNNNYCDCDDSDGYYIGGFEVDDGIDNDCDGRVDNSAIVRCTMADTDSSGVISILELQAFINKWKTGQAMINLQALLDVIDKWKNGC